jgi:DNA helicase-2/ATP-dependent DNA helicase PcrA
VASASYEAADVDLGTGAFDAEPRPRSETADAGWHAGDRVRHRRFGEGIVVSSQVVKGDEEVTVAFVGQGVKRLIAAYAGLERA